MGQRIEVFISTSAKPAVVDEVSNFPLSEAGGVCISPDQPSEKGEDNNPVELNPSME